MTIGTVTAQLLYEIGEPGYANPDVIARFDAIELTPAGPNPVSITNNQGLAPTSGAVEGREIGYTRRVGATA